MRLIGTIIALVVCGAASAAARRLPDVDASIDRGLAFLAADALKWKAEHSCVSCHHAALVAWSMREAKLQGYAVDEPVLAEMSTWVAESGDGRTGVPRPVAAPRALNSKAVWFALALGADPRPDAATGKGLSALLKTVMSDQTDEGSWAAWPETRPPMFGGSDETMTVLATLTLLPAASEDPAAAAARDEAVDWLARTATDGDPQSAAMRLVLWRRLGRPAEQWMPLARRIREHQNPDGGWSQSNDMPSDAWATGQALYALASAGIGPVDPAVERARTFLTDTQRQDGSWPMSSRPKAPGDKGATNLVPITGAGAAWAVLGLVRSTHPQRDQQSATR